MMKRSEASFGWMRTPMKELARKTIAITAFVAMALQADAYDIRSGILSYYPFNTTATDDAAFGNHFTALPATNPPVLVTTGTVPRDSAIQFNGTNQYLRIDHDTANTATGFPIYRAGTYSVSMWVKASPQTAKYIFASGNSTNTTGTAGLFLLQTGQTTPNNNKFDVYLRTDGNVALLNHVVSTNVVFDNTWHHVAWVDDRGSARLYIDGNLDPANFNYTPSGTFSLDRTAVGALVRNNVAGYFNGAVDDLAIFERALTQTEVQEIMANGITTPVPGLPPIILKEPVSVTRHYQDHATFSVTAVGTRPNHALSYQWFKGGDPIPDATTRVHRTFNLTTDNSGEVYSVTVSNDAGAGSATSADAVLTVLPDGPADLRAGIVSYWPLDDVTNNSGAYSTIDLYSRNDLNLTNMTEANVAAGQFGNSLAFDNATTTHAVRSGGAPIYSTQGYSVSAWVKTGDPTHQPDVRIYSEGSNISDAPLFTIGAAGTANPGLAKIYIRNDLNRALLDRASTRTVFDGNWHHILWTDTNGVGRLYVDGVLDETDFSYTPDVLTLNVSSVGAVVRKSVLNMIWGNIDEVATWNRIVSYTEVQDVINSGIPLPLGALPPSIITDPVSTNVMTRADVTFSVLVGGTAPFSYQWYKGSSPVATGTGSVLLLPNVQLSDAGNYYVTVSNSAGTNTSASATLGVTTRPAAPTSFAVDFNHRNFVEGYTEDGFQSFILDGTGDLAISTPTSRLFGGVEVIVRGSNVTPVSSRRRGSPTNSVTFTEEKLLQDFIYSTPTNGLEGLDVTVKYLEPNQLYTVTLWSFDSQNFGDRISDWYANEVLVKDNYIFEGSAHPTNNQRYQMNFTVTSDANGTIALQGRREAIGNGISVFLNALKIQIPITRVSNVERVGGNLRLTIETPDSSQAHNLEETSLLPAVNWVGVAGSTTILSPTSLQIEFTPPAGQTRFYRIVRAE